MNTQKPGAAAVRDQEAPKGEAELVWVGNVSATVLWEGWRAELLMLINHDKQDANCHHKQSNISHS